MSGIIERREAAKEWLEANLTEAGQIVFKHYKSDVAVLLDSYVEFRLKDYIEASEDKKRLTREMDIIINGEGAAKQASLCDIVSQLRTLHQDKEKFNTWLFEKGWQYDPTRDKWLMPGKSQPYSTLELHTLWCLFNTKPPEKRD